MPTLSRRESTGCLLETGRLVGNLRKPHRRKCLYLQWFLRGCPRLLRTTRRGLARHRTSAAKQRPLGYTVFLVQNDSRSDLSATVSVTAHPNTLKTKPPPPPTDRATATERQFLGAPANRWIWQGDLEQSNHLDARNMFAGLDS
jgi:hypothetical protein